MMLQAAFDRCPLAVHSPRPDRREQRTPGAMGGLDARALRADRPPTHRRLGRCGHSAHQCLQTAGVDDGSRRGLVARERADARADRPHRPDRAQPGARSCSRQRSRSCSARGGSAPPTTRQTPSSSPTRSGRSLDYRKVGEAFRATVRRSGRATPTPRGRRWRPATRRRQAPPHRDRSPVVTAVVTVAASSPPSR
jgi:hypothetical protein